MPGHYTAEVIVHTLDERACAYPRGQRCADKAPTPCIREYACVDVVRVTQPSAITYPNALYLNDIGT